MSIGDRLKNMLSKNSPASSQDAVRDNVDNPYLTARRTWNAHTGSVVSSRQAWQVMAILGMLIALTAVGGNVWIGAQSKFIPYVVPVDAVGRAGSPEILDRAKDVTQDQVQAALSEFVEDFRVVSPDIALQRKAIFRAYAHLAPDDPATLKMTEWFNGTPESNPFKRAETETVSTTIQSAIAQTPETWQIDWLETTRDRKGSLKSPPVRMRALVTYYVVASSPKTTEEDIRKNPLRLFVRDLSWSKQL